MFDLEVHDEKGTKIYVIETDKAKPKDSHDAVKLLFSSLMNEKSVSEMLNKIKEDDIVSINDVDFTGKDVLDYLDVALGSVVRCLKCERNIDIDLVNAYVDMEEKGFLCEPCTSGMEECSVCYKVGYKPDFKLKEDVCNKCCNQIDKRKRSTKIKTA